MAIIANLVVAEIGALECRLVFDLGVTGANLEDFRLSRNGGPFVSVFTDITQPNPNELRLAYALEPPLAYGDVCEIEYVGITLTQVYNGCKLPHFKQALVNLLEPREPDIEADVQAFIDVYGWKEAVEISNLDNPAAQTPNYERIARAIADARVFIESYIAAATWAGKAVIRGSQSRTELIIARYYLDSKRRRRDVLEDYERALQMIESARQIDTPPPQDDGEGQRYLFKVSPKEGRYNRYTKKGLKGWWTD